MREIMVKGDKFSSNHYRCCSNPEVIFSHIPGTQTTSKPSEGIFTLAKHIQFNIGVNKGLMVNRNWPQRHKKLLKFGEFFIFLLSLSGKRIQFRDSNY